MCVYVCVCGGGGGGQGRVGGGVGWRGLGAGGGDVRRMGYSQKGDEYKMINGGGWWREKSEAWDNVNSKDDDQ